MNSDRTSTIVTTSSNNKRRRVSDEGLVVSADGGANQPPEAVASAVRTSAAPADRNNSVVYFHEPHNLESFAIRVARKTPVFHLTQHDIRLCIFELDRAKKLMVACDSDGGLGDSYKIILRMKAAFLRFEEFIMNIRQTGTFCGLYMLDIFKQLMGINHSNYQSFIDEVKKNINLLLDAQGGRKHGASDNSISGSISRGAPNLTHFVQCLEQVFGEKTEARCMAEAKSYLVRILPRGEQQQQQEQWVARNNNNDIDVSSAVSYWRFAHELVSPLTWEEIPELLLVKMQKDNEEEVTDAINNLAKLLTSESENGNEDLDEALKLGAHSIIIGKMRKYPYNGYVQHAGCFIMFHLSLTTSFKGAIVKAGGMEAVYNAMKIFPNSSDIQNFGLATCWHLFILSDVLLKKASERFVNDLGGIQLAVARMKKFPERPNLIYSCCGLFACLAQEQAFHGPMRAAGVVGVVGNAVDRYFNNQHIKKSAAIFMKKMLP